MDGHTAHTRPQDLPIFYVDRSMSWDLPQWLRDNHDLVEEQLAGQGAILLRGLDISSAARLDDFVSMFPLKNFTYNDSLSNALRVNKTERVFTANEAPPALDIVLHHEMAQTPSYPDWLFFSCELKPEAGGNTPICRSDLVYQDLLQKLPVFLSKCEEQGLYYKQKFAFNPDQNSAQGRSWPHLLRLVEENIDLPQPNQPGNTDNLDNEFKALQHQAEKQLRLKGYTFTWHKDTLEIISPVLPAVRRAKNNQKVFFNQLLAAYTSWTNDLNHGPSCVFFGQGQAIDEYDIQTLEKICRAHTRDICWDTGDVAILDNAMVMHGRRAFSGKRQVYASLAQDIT